MLACMWTSRSSPAGPPPPPPARRAASRASAAPPAGRRLDTELRMLIGCRRRPAAAFTRARGCACRRFSGSGSGSGSSSGSRSGGSGSGSRSGGRGTSEQARNKQRRQGWVRVGAMHPMDVVRHRMYPGGITPSSCASDAKRLGSALALLVPGAVVIAHAEEVRALNSQNYPARLPEDTAADRVGHLVHACVGVVGDAAPPPGAGGCGQGCL